MSQFLGRGAERRAACVHESRCHRPSRLVLIADPPPPHLKEYQCGPNGDKRRCCVSLSGGSGTKVRERIFWTFYKGLQSKLLKISWQKTFQRLLESGTKNFFSILFCFLQKWGKEQRNNLGLFDVEMSKFFRIRWKLSGALAKRKVNVSLTTEWSVEFSTSSLGPPCGARAGLVLMGRKITQILNSNRVGTPGGWTWWG